jgi:hypothetical protein
MTAMAAMATDERQAMGQAGRELVESEFGEARVIKAYLEAVAQLCPPRESLVADV